MQNIMPLYIYEQMDNNGTVQKYVQKPAFRINSFTNDEIVKLKVLCIYTPDF